MANFKANKKHGTYYFVNAGVNKTHSDFMSKCFNLQKDAIAYWQSLDRSDEALAYSCVKTNEGVLVREFDNGKENKTFKASVMGFDFEAYTKAELFKQLKTWYNENEEVLLEYGEFDYFGNIERASREETHHVLHTLNGMIKKKLRTDNEKINNYKI